MKTTTVRIEERTQETLKTLAAESGTSMQEVLARAVEAYRRQHLIDQTNAAYAALRRDPAAWQAEQAERAAWDATLSDGLAGA
jgi:hypothetical protein